MKVSKINFGLTKIKDSIYLYVLKENSLSLNFIKNYKNVKPIDFETYCNAENKTNSSFSNSTYNDAGMNVNGYTFEFNINFFLRSLKSFLELPNLLFDLNKQYNYKDFYHEVDIAYYTKQKIDINNNNIKMFKPSLYFLINNNNISLKKMIFKY